IIAVNIGAYLKRINYRGPATPTAETLRDLQVAHLLTVPFENLSIHTGEPIVLDDEALFTKIVERRRGGFCYEANGLFAVLLRAIGFDVAMLAAEVASPEGVYSQPFDHMVLMVRLDESWLVDVGFGDSFLEPLKIYERADQVQRNFAYRIVADGGYLVVVRKNQDDWKPQYRFTLQPHEFQDFAEMCRYHQTSPQSHFTQGTICSRATEEGRITLSGMRFIRTGSNGEREERTLGSQQEYDTILRRDFGIVMR